MIRPAKKEDIKQLVPLIMIILRDMELPLLKTLGEDKIMALLEEASQEDSYRYGIARALVVEKDGVIEGVAYGYGDEDEPIIDREWTRLLKEYGIEADNLFEDKETYPNEWYLDSLVVRKEARGRGYGSQLLDAVQEVAKTEGYPCVGLNVDKQNPKAAALYHRKGFEKVGDMMISGHDYDHLQRKVNVDKD